MLKRASVATLLLVTFVSASFAQRAGVVRMADEDSMVAVSAAPYQFSASGNRPLGTVITAHVYYALEVPSLLAWETVIVNEQGLALRTIPGARPARPGEPLMIVQGWDGRDDNERVVAPGIYRVTVRVRVAQSASVAADASFASLGGAADAEEIAAGVSSVRVVGAPSGILPSTKSAPITALGAPPPPGEPGFPFNFYFGSLHNQTSFTDGGHPNDATCTSSTTHVPTDFTPAQAYDYARTVGKLDFLGITDHNHLFDTACPGCSSATVIQRYHDGLTAAAAANVDGAFVAIYGMEWGYISNDSFPNEGHINLFEIPKLFGWKTGFYEVFTDPAGPSYPALYTASKLNPSPWGAFGSFNHPGTTAGGDFNQFGYTTDGDDVMALAAIISGPASGFSTTQADSGNRYAGPNISLYPPWASYDVYNRILGAGFHVAPVADPDVHCSNYGTSTHDRTVILAPSLTKAAIFDAIKNRRVYATSDATAQLVFTLKDPTAVTHYMGEGSSRTAGPVPVSGAVTLHVLHYNINGKTASSIKIFEPVPNNLTGESTLVASGIASPFDFTFTPSTGIHTYYAYVTQIDGAEIWSAPIWINEGVTATPDFSVAATPSSQTVTAGASASYTATVTPSGGFSGAVTFSATGLPAGAAASFSPASVTTSGSSTMTVSTTSSTPPGTYAVTITGTSGALTRSTTVSLVVNPPAAPDFSLAVSPSSVTLPSTGGTASYTITITPTGGFSSAVSLSVSGLPAGATGSFSPNPASGTSSALTLTVSSTTTAGTYVFTVTGAGGSPTLTRTATATLVKSSATCTSGDCS